VGIAHPTFLTPNTNNGQPVYIKVPAYTWKVVLSFDKVGDPIENATGAFAVWMPNQDLRGDSTDWLKYIISVEELEIKLNQNPLVKYNFFNEIGNIAKRTQLRTQKIVNIGGIPLMADNGQSDLELLNANTSIWHDGVVKADTTPIYSFNGAKNSISEIGSGQVRISHNTLFQVGISQVSPSEIGSNHIAVGSDFAEIGVGQIGITQDRSREISFSQIGVGQVGTFETHPIQLSFSQIGSTQIASSEIGNAKSSKMEVNPTQIGIDKNILVRSMNANPLKISFPSGISSQQFFGGNVNSPISFNEGFNNQPIIIHETLSNLLTNVYSTAQSIWHFNNAINLNFEITNLPTGQLAEATITGYDQLGRPNKATISIDDDANGVGWFIDTTPGDSSEFRRGDAATGGLGDYFIADPNSAAAGKYDLLTAILHEMGHTLGFINGYSQFNQNIKGRQFYTDSTHSYTLSSDLEHLDNTLYPNDLLNTNLKPGIRKLPSAIDWAIINALNSGVGSGVSSVSMFNPAHLTAGALIGITNGDFTTSTTWNTLGATNIINGTATLTEQSQKLSELTQAFIIPIGAKTLQFTIKDNHLVTGDTTKTANDAFEVALLDTNTFNPLAGTSIGLNHTDSLLNIQANGTIHKSDKVTITPLGNNSSIITIDLTQIAPTTQATLYFNLLGFGARTSIVTIDDVKLFTDTQPIPVTNNDTLVTNQNTPLTLDPTQLTTNDTNVTQIQIINQPTHGTLTQTPDGKLTYQPIPTYVGNDSFTYLGFGSDGQISNLATVNLTINNLAPTIETLTIPNHINEGQTIQLKATAKDGGSSDNLTYTWDLGDNSQPVIGQNVTHQFVDNGTYNVVLTVTDKDGGITQQSTQIKVDNVAPTATITTPNTILNQGESLNLSWQGRWVSRLNPTYSLMCLPKRVIITSPTPSKSQSPTSHPLLMPSIFP
jgi:PKD domain/Bacterial Ig domain